MDHKSAVRIVIYQNEAVVDILWIHGHEQISQHCDWMGLNSVEQSYTTECRDWISLLLCIWKVLSSNANTNLRIVHNLDHDHFLPFPFQFIIH
jgi:hypothetical protein